MENRAVLRIANAWSEKAGTWYGFCPDYPEMGTFEGPHLPQFRDSYEAAFRAFSLTEAFRNSPLVSGEIRNPFSRMTDEEKKIFNHIKKPGQSDLTI
jgi:hypothetical protein